MKKFTNFVAIFCSILLLCVAMTGNGVIAESSYEWVEPFLPPTSPDEPHLYYQLNDLEKLIGFFEQEDPEGVSNGYKVLGDYPTDLTYPIGMATGDKVTEGYRTSLTYPIGIPTVLWDGVRNDDENAWDHTILCLQDMFFWGGWDLRHADYYGDLDLSGTTIVELSLTRGHITSVNLDDCESLSVLSINFSDTCHSVSAVNANIQTGKVTLACGAKSMRLGLNNFDSDVNVYALGNGCVGADFDNEDSANTMIKSKSKGSQSLIGWFKNGEFFTRASCIVISEGGNYFAAFAGDVNDDGNLNAVDVLQLMREAMGLIEINNVDMSDINCNGFVGLDDAVPLLRAVMGI